MSDFTEAFERGTEGLEFISVGACSNCVTCYDDFGGGGPKDFVDAVEGGEYCGSVEFTRAECDFCGSMLGGSREAAHAVLDGSLEHFEDCVDCVMYIANGDEPEEWRR